MIYKNSYFYRAELSRGYKSGARVQYLQFFFFFASWTTSSSPADKYATVYQQHDIIPHCSVQEDDVIPRSLQKSLNRGDLTDAEALRPTWEAACRCPWSPGTWSWCSRRWRRSAPSQRAADPRWCPDPGPGHSGTCAGSETVGRREEFATQKNKREKE